MLAYLAAVTQRSTMGAVSIEATHRFSTTAEQLASLAVWQIAVYAAMQIPVGILLDRYGAKKLLVLGAVVMATGQVFVAISTSLGVAVFGRILVGLGDAFTFISLIRLINGWYTGKKASLLQQWLGNAGQLGQVVSAIPFAALAGTSGWTAAFLTFASASGAVAVLAVFFIQDDRDPTQHHYSKRTIREGFIQVRQSMKRPAVRLAFWTHFSTQSVGTVFVLLWGLPFLVSGQGVDKGIAHVMLSSFVFIGIAAGLFYGWVCSARPDLRTPVVITMATAVCLAWFTVILAPGPAPPWLLWLLIGTMAVAGPASMIAFDYSREHVAKGELGTANGFVNIGGFLATFIMMFMIGILLDLHYSLTSQSSALYGLDGFRFAMPVQLLVIGVGIFFNLREAKLLRLEAKTASLG